MPDFSQQATQLKDLHEFLNELEKEIQVVSPHYHIEQDMRYVDNELCHIRVRLFHKKESFAAWESDNSYVEWCTVPGSFRGWLEGVDKETDPQVNLFNNSTQFKKIWREQILFSVASFDKRLNANKGLFKRIFS